jgi:hypothetical protein
MAVTHTPLLNLIKPTPGTHEPYSIANDNANMDILDQAITLTGTQTLANKTLTNSGGITVTSGSLTVFANNTILGGVAPTAPGNGLWLFGNPTSNIGNAANVNLVTPAIGSGGGPSTMTVVKWAKVGVDIGVFWLPLFQ